MSEVTKADVNRIYDAITPMQQDIAAIKTKLDLMPAPPEQPCAWHNQLRDEFDDHTNEHRQNTRDWKQAAIKATVDIVKIAIVAALGLFLGMRLS